MSKGPASPGQHFQDVLAVAFLGWLTWACVHGLSKVLRTGTIKNWRGPDTVVSENPLVFWALSGFFGLGTILIGGMAVLCLWIAITNVTRK